MLRFPPTTISVTVDEVNEYDLHRRYRGYLNAHSAEDASSWPQADTESSDVPPQPTPATSSVHTDDEADEAAYFSPVVSADGALDSALDTPTSQPNPAS